GAIGAVPIDLASHLVIHGLCRRDEADRASTLSERLSVPALATANATKHQRDGLTGPVRHTVLSEGRGNK
ncbi:MAG: hypothetical protein QOH85_1110, partial [Acidobacteriaceae bacterium]|nr:hypothetical protein [Acidobacteriaceae bacterium]